MEEISRRQGFPWKKSYVLAILVTALGLAGLPLEAQSLRPSRASLNRQNAQAQAHNFTYIQNARQVRQFVERGYLVPVRGNRNLKLHNVSFPYARPEVRLFLDRLSRQHRTACGQPLVVTSLTRPKTHQPRNASRRSTHPTGMALDLRRSKNSKCRTWLERTLLYLEGQRVLEASVERWPPHYHLALFPKPYASYVERRLEGLGPAPTHRVAAGESLWEIARRYDTNVYSLKRANGLRGNTIRPGQKLRIPSG